MKKVVAFLQNQWFKDPDRARKLLALYLEPGEGDGREAFVRDMLFLGCATGRNLLRAFGEDLCDYGGIVWEEASREIHGDPKKCPPADPAHMLEVLEKHKPDVVILFGKVALEGFTTLLSEVTLPNDCRWFGCPHPAARGPAVVPALRDAAAKLRAILEAP